MTTPAEKINVLQDLVTYGIATEHDVEHGYFPRDEEWQDAWDGYLSAAWKYHVLRHINRQGVTETALYTTDNWKLPTAIKALMLVLQTRGNMTKGSKDSERYKALERQYNELLHTTEIQTAENTAQPTARGSVPTIGGMAG